MGWPKCDPWVALAGTFPAWHPLIAKFKEPGRKRLAKQHLHPARCRHCTGFLTAGDSHRWRFAHPCLAKKKSVCMANFKYQEFWYRRSLCLVLKWRWDKTTKCIGINLQKELRINYKVNFHFVGEFLLSLVNVGKILLAKLTLIHFPLINQPNVFNASIAWTAYFKSFDTYILTKNSSCQPH